MRFYNIQVSSSASSTASIPFPLPPPFLTARSEQCTKDGSASGVTCVFTIYKSHLAQVVQHPSPSPSPPLFSLLAPHRLVSPAPISNNRLKRLHHTHHHQHSISNPKTTSRTRKTEARKNDLHYHSAAPPGPNNPQSPAISATVSDPTNSFAAPPTDKTPGLRGERVPA